MNEINRERFEAWLFAQPKERVIEAGNGSECFVCSFLKETSHLTKPRLFWDSWLPEGLLAWGGKSYNDAPKLPLWVIKLIDPLWLHANSSKASWQHLPISAGQMQARYAQLFGNPLDGCKDLTEPLKCPAS